MVNCARELDTPTSSRISGATVLKNTASVAPTRDACCSNGTKDCQLTWLLRMHASTSTATETFTFSSGRGGSALTQYSVLKVASAPRRMLSGVMVAASDGLMSWPSHKCTTADIGSSVQNTFFTSTGVAGGVGGGSSPLAAAGGSGLRKGATTITLSTAEASCLGRCSRAAPPPPGAIVDSRAATVCSTTADAADAAEKRFDGSTDGM